MPLPSLFSTLMLETWHKLSDVRPAGGLDSYAGSSVRPELCNVHSRRSTPDEPAMPGLAERHKPDSVPPEHGGAPQVASFLAVQTRFPTRSRSMQAGHQSRHACGIRLILAEGLSKHRFFIAHAAIL